MKGYIALISVLIISAILMLIALSASHFGISQLTMALQKNQSSESYYLAMACAEEALMKLKEDLGYRGDETLNIDGASCNILRVEGRGNKDRIIKTRSNAHNQTKKIKIEINRVNPETKIKSWQEVADF